MSLQSSRSSVPMAITADAFTKEIIRNEFSSIPDILDLVPREDWGMFADHLFALCDELGPLPILMWNFANRALEGPEAERLTESFGDMLVKRLIFDEANVRWTRDLIGGVYQQAKSVCEDMEDVNGEKEREMISEMICDILQKVTEWPMESRPIATSKIAAVHHFAVGHGSEIVPSLYIIFIQNTLIAAISNPMLVALDKIDYVRPAKLQMVLDEIARQMGRYCALKSCPVVDEPYKSKLEYWGNRMAEVVGEQMSSVDQMFKIWQAQYTPSSKRVAKFESNLRSFVEIYSDRQSRSTRSVTQDSDDSHRSEIFEKMQDRHWKSGKEENQISNFVWSKGNGIGVRVEGQVSGDVVSVLRLLTKRIFHTNKLLSDVQMKLIDTTESEVQFRINAPFPFAPRFISSNIRFDLSDDEGVAIFADSTQPRTPSGHHRGKMLLSGIRAVAMKEEPGKVWVCVVLHIDMCASVPNWVLYSQNKSLRKILISMLGFTNTVARI